MIKFCLAEFRAMGAQFPIGSLFFQKVSRKNAPTSKASCKVWEETNQPAT